MTKWEPLNSIVININEELFRIILRGLCGDNWFSCEIRDRSDKVIAQFYTLNGNATLRGLAIEKNAPIYLERIRTRIGNVNVIVDSELGHKPPLEASKLIAQSIEHRVERILLDRQLGVRDDHAQKIDSILDQLTPSQDISTFWEQVNNVVDQLCPVIGAIGGMYVQPQSNSPIKAASINYFSLVDQIVEITPQMITVLTNARPKIIKVTISDLGNSEFEKVIKSQGLGRTRLIMTVPLLLHPDIQSRILFVIDDLGDERHLLSIEEDLKLLSIVVGRISTAYSTSIRLQEQQLIALQKDRLVHEKTEYIHVITHQLLQPLGSLVLYCESLLDEQIGFEKKQQYSRWIPSIARSWAGFVYTVAWASRREDDIFQDSPDVQFKACKITPILISCAIDMQPFAQEQQGKYVTVDTELCEYVDNSAQVKLSELHIRQAIMNLIHNAIKYSFPKSTIAIRAYVDKHAMSITVENIGIPIQVEEQNIIFTKGGRTNLAREIDPGGTGLGLFIVSEVMKLHDGSVSVHCQANPKDRSKTTFVLSFPLHLNKR